MKKMVQNAKFELPQEPFLNLSFAIKQLMKIMQIWDLALMVMLIELLELIQGNILDGDHILFLVGEENF